MIVMKTRLGLVWLVLLPSSVAIADETWRKDRFAVAAGLYKPNVSTVVSVANQATGRSGTLLDLETDLDLKDADTLLTLDLHYRFSRRHAIELEWVQLERDSIKVITRQINYDDEVFNIGARSLIREPSLSP